MVANNFPKGTEVDLKIPMLPDMELAAAKTAEAMAEYANFSEDEIEEIKMALIEACINAFEHSDSMDRNVYITFHVEKEKMVVQIRDKGKGFDKKGVETRPIISGNFINQPATKLFKLNKKNEKFPEAQKVENLSFFIEKMFLLL